MGILLLAALLQVPVDTGAAGAAQDSALRVFLDCPNVSCDFDYFRTEITFVNWVRDRHDAQVHLLITAQGTGGGGLEHTLAFIGLARFAGSSDTLSYVSENTATGDERRKGLAQTIRLGLVRFAARTPVASRLQVRYDAPPAAAARVRDPWNYWVFRLGLNPYLQGEKLVRFVSLDGELSASRVTERWKILLEANESYNQSDYDVVAYDSLGVPTDTERVKSITRNYYGAAQIGRAAGPHWSVGVRSSVFSSTYSNQRLTLRTGPVLEYDVWPYSQSTRRLFTFQYALGVLVADYEDTTIYDRTSETRLHHSLTATVDVKQPWGSVRMFLEGSHYLSDVRKNRFLVGGNLQYRVFKGLSVNGSGRIELIHDQLFLPKGGASEQDVLLRRRELETSYRFYVFGGLTYTFGSKFANVVNPRLRD